MQDDRASLALAALAEVTDPESVGELVEVLEPEEGVRDLVFACRLAAYTGWRWTVSTGRVADAEPTVLEVELLPGEGSLLAPPWVPWAERLAEYRRTHPDDDELGDDLDEDDDEDEDEDDEDLDDEDLDPTDDVLEIDGVDFEDAADEADPAGDAEVDEGEDLEPDESEHSRDGGHGSDDVDEPDEADAEHDGSDAAEADERA